MAQASELASPVVCCAAGFHENDGWWLLTHKTEQLTSRHPALLTDPARVMGDGELENRLGEIEGKDGMLHGGLLLVLRTVMRPGTMMPHMPREESMSSIRNVEAQLG